MVVSSSQTMHLRNFKILAASPLALSFSQTFGQMISQSFLFHSLFYTVLRPSNSGGCTFLPLNSSSCRGGYCSYYIPKIASHYSGIFHHNLDTKTWRIPTPALLAVVEGRLSGDAGGSYILIRPQPPARPLEREL